MTKTDNNKSLYFFINPISGKGVAKKIFTKVSKALCASGIDVKLYVSKYKGDIADNISNIDLTDVDGVVVIGGDGTIHEAINGLIKSGKYYYLPMGVIPAGSGNAYASDLNINDLDQAINTLIKFEIKKIDIMQINHRDGISYSANILGWGMATRVNKIAEKLRFLGGIRYTIASIICIIFLKPERMDFNIDDKVIKAKGLLFLALNTVHTGKGMKMAPTAEMDDGLLDIILFKNATRLNIFRIFMKIYNGEHIYCEGVEYIQAKQFAINTLNDSLNIDGENMGYSPVKVRLLANKLKIFS